MKKFVTVLVALVAIALIAYFGVGRQTIDKYTYGTDWEDLQSYFGVSGEELAIILQSDRLEDKALLRNEICYFSLKTVDEVLGEGFYLARDYQGGCLLYTTATGTFELPLGSSSYFNGANNVDMGYTLAFEKEGEVYIAAEYVKLFSKFSYDVYEYRVQVYTQWDNYQEKNIVKDTQVRTLGGIKSPILAQLEEGDKVELLDEMESWSKVKTSDGIIGYVENKRMEGMAQVTRPEPVEVNLPKYTSHLLDEKVCLGFHSIGGPGGNDTLKEMISESVSMNVIAPTWFSLTDDEGNYRSFASADYVKKAHDKEIQVWGVFDNFNYENETGNPVDDFTVLSSTQTRRRLEENLVAEAVELGLDGINLDFEGLTSDCGIHFVQFLKELSILCHNNNLILSIDNYVPFSYNDFYRIDIQGQVADYVLIMGYDEHYHGSGDPGSVASISYVSNGLDKTLETVAAEKVINAIPFYTIVWKTSGDTTTDQYLTLNNQAEYVTKLGLDPQWNEETCQNYCKWTSGGAVYQLWLEDTESITVKLNVMNAKEIGGVGVWRLGYGTPEVWNLISLYAEN